MTTYRLTLEGFSFPQDLSRNRSNFRFLVDLRYLDQKRNFQTSHAVMPSLDTFWECDPRRDEKPNYVRAGSGAEFDMSRVDCWDRLIHMVTCERLLAIQFKVFDVNRPDAWDRMKSFAGGVAGALVGRVRRELPQGGMFARPMGGAADDLESFLLFKLAGGGDRLLFRGSKAISESSETLCVSGTGSEGQYCVRIRTQQVSVETQEAKDQTQDAKEGTQQP